MSAVYDLEAHEDEYVLAKRRATLISNLKCNNACCRSQARVGYWLCSQKQHAQTVADWLRSHAYEEQSFYDHDFMPPTATIALLTGMHDSAATSEQSLLTKRLQPARTEKSVKTQRREYL